MKLRQYSVIVSTLLLAALMSFPISALAKKGDSASNHIKPTPKQPMVVQSNVSQQGCWGDWNYMDVSSDKTKDKGRHFNCPAGTVMIKYTEDLALVTDPFRQWQHIVKGSSVICCPMTHDWVESVK